MEERDIDGERHTYKVGLRTKEFRLLQSPSTCCCCWCEKQNRLKDKIKRLPQQWHHITKAEITTLRRLPYIPSILVCSLFNRQ